VFGPPKNYPVAPPVIVLELCIATVKCEEPLIDVYNETAELLSSRI
jgi:hypothetical protein